jgi:tripartite ATP-independent transporter DctP family solute receptor
MFGFIRTATMALALSTLAIVPATAAQKLRFAGNFPPEHPATRAMEVFKKEVEAASNGELEVDIFPAMQLGGASENVDQVRSGTIFAMIASIAYFTRITPEFEAISLPFIFENRVQAFKLVDGPVGDALNKKLGEKGFINLGYMELGFRHVTNSVRPIKSLDDFKGLKIRLQPNEVHLATFRALGASPVAMDIKELYSALQQGVLDGQENPYDTIYTRRFHEVQKYLSNTGHFYDFINVVANKRIYDRLSEPHRKAVDQAMQKAVAWQRAEAERLDLEWRDKLLKLNMQYDEISPEVRAQLRQATASVVDGVKSRIGAEFVEMVQKELSK